jgi:hypothetical protein
MRKLLQMVILLMSLMVWIDVQAKSDVGLLDELTQYRELLMAQKNQLAREVQEAEKQYRETYQIIMIQYSLGFVGRDLENVRRDSSFLGQLFSQVKIYFMPFELQFGRVPRAALNSKREMFIVFDLLRWKKFSFHERALLMLTEISRFQDPNLSEEQRYSRAAEMLRAFYAIDTSLVLKFPALKQENRALKDKFNAQIDLHDAYQRKDRSDVVASIMTSMPDSEKLTRDHALTDAKYDRGIYEPYRPTSYYLTNFISISDPKAGRSYLYLLDADASIFKINQCVKTHPGVVNPSQGTWAFDPEWANFCYNRLMRTTKDHTFMISRKSKVVTSCDSD